MSWPYILHYRYIGYCQITNGNHKSYEEERVFVKNILKMDSQNLPKLDRSWNSSSNLSAFISKNLLIISESTERVDLFLTRIHIFMQMIAAEFRGQYHNANYRKLDGKTYNVLSLGYHINLNYHGYYTPIAIWVPVSFRVDLDNVEIFDEKITVISPEIYSYYKNLRGKMPYFYDRCPSLPKNST